MVDTLEDEICRRVFDGNPRPIFWKGMMVGEGGAILGNLEQGEEFESLVLNLWL